MQDDDLLPRVSDLQKWSKFRSCIAEYCRDAVTPAEIVGPTHKILNQGDRYLVSFMLIHNDYAQRRHGGPRATLTAL